MIQEDKDNIPIVEKDGWSSVELAEQATNEDSDDIVRKMLRGGESEINADDYDLADSPSKIKRSND